MLRWSAESWISVFHYSSVLYMNIISNSKIIDLFKIQLCHWILRPLGTVNTKARATSLDKTQAFKSFSFTCHAFNSVIPCSNVQRSWYFSYELLKLKYPSFSIYQLSTNLHLSFQNMSHSHSQIYLFPARRPSSNSHLINRIFQRQVYNRSISKSYS